jgi:stress response protein SCP2
LCFVSFYFLFFLFFLSFYSQKFNVIKNAYVRLLSGAILPGTAASVAAQELVRFTLSSFTHRTALIMAVIYRDCALRTWNIKALATPTDGKTYESFLPDMVSNKTEKKELFQSNHPDHFIV